jgi:hypothetical protein
MRIKRKETRGAFFSIVLMEYALCMLTFVCGEGFQLGLAAATLVCMGAGFGALLYERKHGGDFVAD